jgi:hypothetical protein
VSRARRRQRNAKLRPAGSRFNQVELAAMQLGDTTSDREAKARTARRAILGARANRVDAEESLEHPLMRVGWKS